MSKVFSSFDDLYSQIKIACPSCPDNQISFELSKAVRNFFIRTESWKFIHSVLLEEDVTSYKILFENDVYITNLETATVDDVDVLSSVEIASSDTVVLTPYFIERHLEKTLCMKFVVAPLTFPCFIPVHIVNRYFDFFIAGAVKNIASASRKPYSNPEQAAAAFLLWQDGLTRASTDVATGIKNRSVGFKG